MTETVSELLLRSYTRTQRRLLEAVDAMTEEQFRASVAPSLHSAAYQLWHAARWDDVLAAVLCRNSPPLLERVGTAEQLWDRQGLAAVWGLPSGEMGQRDSGTGLSDDAADGLILPERRLVRAYAEGAFDFVAKVFGAIDDALFLEPAPRDPHGDSYGENLLIYADHDSRHLGMIEAIRGLLGLRGSASD